MTDPEGGGLSGWSRRKLEAKRQEQAEAPPPEAPAAQDPQEEIAPVLADADMIAALPSLDEIKAGFDMAPFLAKGVPAHLKNAALRKLWQASPAVRDYLDPAVDYAWDWNAPGGVPGGGGVLSQESIAKMVKGIIGTKSEDAHEEEIVAEVQLPNPDQADVVDQANSPEPLAVRAPEKQRTTAARPDVEDTSRKSSASDLSPKRRHGSATPE